MPEAGPWDKYAQPEQGPWTKYAQPAPAAPPAPKDSGLLGRARQFTQDHPYATAAASLLPGVGPAISGLTDPRGDVGRGALKQIGRDAYGITEGAGPLGMAAHAVAERTGLGSKIRAATEPSNPAQEVGGYATTAAEMALPGPGEYKPFSKLRGPAESLYGSALKPPITGGIDATKQLVRTGLSERLPVSENGVRKLQGKIGDVNQQIGQHVANSDFHVDPEKVAGRVDQIRPTFENQVNPDKDLSSLGKVKSQYLEKHTTHAPFTRVAPGAEDGGEAGRLVPVGQGSTPMTRLTPAPEAQAEKVGTYRQLAGKYGELGNADMEGQKALARGLKEELGYGIPQIVPLNAREGRLIDLEGPLERAAMRGGNRDVVPIGSASVSAAKKLLDSPAMKSHGAIQMDRLASVPLRFRGMMGGAARLPRLTSQDQ